jgi:hypothetical protein
MMIVLAALAVFCHKTRQVDVDRAQQQMQMPARPLPRLREGIREARLDSRMTRAASRVQVQIGAALLTGLLFGAFQLDKNEETYLAYAVNSKFVELGNNLVKRRARTHASMLEISYALPCDGRRPYAE